MPRRKVQGISDLDTQFLLCRDLNHRWDIVRWERWQLDRVQRILRCRRCKTMRIDRLRHDGTLYARNYEYSDNYLLEGIKDRKLGIRVANIREELIARIEAADQLVEQKSQEE